MNELYNIGERIKELMNFNNINAEQLSREIGVSSSVILRWTKKNYSLKYSNLKKLSDYFKCSFEYLIGRKDIDENYIYKPFPVFSKRLKEILKEFNVSVYRICKDTKLTRSRFDEWFKGVEPTLSSLIILADYLGCSIDYLTGRES